MVISSHKLQNRNYQKLREIKNALSALVGTLLVYMTV